MSSISPRFIPGPAHLPPHEFSPSQLRVKHGGGDTARRSSSSPSPGSVSRSVTSSLSSFMSTVTGSSSSSSSSSSVADSRTSNLGINITNRLLLHTGRYPQFHEILSGITNPPPSGTSSSSSLLSQSPLSRLRDVLSMSSNADFISENRRFRQRADWGHSGLVAFCAQHVVMIIDPHSMQWITSLDGHMYSTTAVTWCPRSRKTGMDRGISSILASGDRSGRIIVWDARHARPVCVFQEDGSILLGSGADHHTNRDQFAGNQSSSIYARSNAIVQMHWVDMDNRYLLTLSAAGMLSMWCLRLKRKVWSRGFFGEPVTSFSVDPFNEMRISMCCDNGWIIFANDISTRSAPMQVEKKLRIGGTTDPKTGDVMSTVLRDFVFSPHAESQLYYVSNRDVSVYDLQLRQTLLGKSFGGTRSDFRQVLPVEQNPNLLFSLHEDGSLTAWEFDPNRKNFRSASCDIVRGSKYGADRPGLLYGWAMAPYDPTLFIAVSTDGRIWSWKFDKSALEYGSGTTSSASPSRSIVKSKWILQSMLEGMSHFALSIAVSPFNADIVAVGTINGMIILFDLKTGNLISKHEIFSSEVITVRWLSPSSAIAFTTRYIGNGQFNNQIRIIDLRSGQQRPLRMERAADPSPFLAIRISHSRRYMILLSRDRPIEVWHLGEERLIRVIAVRNFTALDWCHPRTRSRVKKNATAVSSGQPDTETLEQTVEDSSKTSPVESVTPTGNTAPHVVPKREAFIFATSDGSLHFYHVQTQTDSIVHDFTYQNLLYGQTTAIAKLDNYVIYGDTFGNITVIEPKKEQRVIGTGKGMCAKLQFSPDGKFLLAQFGKGEFGVWDMRTMKRISNSLHSMPHVRAIAVDWTKHHHPVIATTSGSLAIVSVGLMTTNESFSFRTLSEPMKSAAMLPPTHAMHLRMLIEHNKLKLKVNENRESELPIDDPYLTSVEGSFRNCFGQLVSDQSQEASLDEQIQMHGILLGENLIQQLQSENLSQTERCILSALYFGDTRALHFWMMAHRFLSLYKSHGLSRASDAIVKPATVREASSAGDRSLHSTEAHIAQVESQSHAANATVDEALSRTRLPAMFGLMRDSETVRNHELAILHSHDESIRASRSDDAAIYFEQVAQGEAMLGQTASAVRLLLETPPGHKNTHMNYMHALVIAAASGPEQFHQTMQFVASSLISLRTEKDILLGIEFLVLIGEKYKACRLLQDFDMWERAASLSKCILPKEQSDEILTRWASHLSSTGQVLKAIGVWLSLGLFYEVLDLLHKLKMDDIAAQFARICQESDIAIVDRGTILPQELMEPLSANKDNNERTDTNEGTSTQVKQEDPVSQLLRNIYANFAAHLEKIGCVELSQEYSDVVSSLSPQAGEEKSTKSEVTEIPAVLDGVPPVGRENSE